MFEWYSKHPKFWIVVLMLLITFGLLSGCEKSKNVAENEKTERIMTVEKKPNVISLYYQGKVKPIDVNKVISPVDGVVSKINFSYGQFVDSDQLLLSISSQKLENDFQQSLSKFLTAKDRLINSEVSFEGAELLYKNEIISKNEYLGEKSRFENNKLSFLEEKIKLQSILSEIPQFKTDIEKLTLSDVDEVQKLYREHIAAIPVKSPATGIALFPEKTKSDDESKKLTIGVEVKSRQSLLSIGDMQGIRVEFTVGQKDINTIKKDLKVKVTNDALENAFLNGVVTEVGVQSTSGEGSDKVEFPIVVQVKNIEKKLQKKLRVGMTAKVQIEIKDEPQIVIPISAVTIKENKRFVTVIDPKTEKKSEREVRTGKTLPKEVIVLTGLKAGEKIVVHD